MVRLTSQHMQLERIGVCKVLFIILKRYTGLHDCVHSRIMCMRIHIYEELFEGLPGVLGLLIRFQYVFKRLGEHVLRIHTEHTIW